MMNSDCISLCSTFSYCSECTNTDSILEPADSSATFSSMPKLNEAEDSLRFSPTSLFSEDSVSLRDFNGAGNAGYSYSTGIGKMQAEMSTLSSVSSITLQDQDEDLSIDTVSLPEDPFPNGLPSSASSTIGSPVSSRSTFSNSSIEGVEPEEKSHRDSVEEKKNEHEAFDSHQLEPEQVHHSFCETAIRRRPLFVQTRLKLNFSA